MISYCSDTSYSPETVALWEPEEDIVNILSPLGIITEISEWKHTLKLEWAPDLLPSCKNCEYATFKCKLSPPLFQCRILTLTKLNSLRPNVYWKRVVDLNV